METPNFPENEEDRQKKLEEYQILDSLPEADYDNITRIASQICNTPISLITLVDQDRQWFKSRHGLDTTETPRAVSFCAHGILQPDEPLIVRNSFEDPRFKDNPLVTSEPHVEFYAGIPLVTPEGHALGSLCVIDDHPRDISQDQIDALKALAGQVVQLLELRRTVAKLKKTEAQLKASNDDLQEFAYHVAHDIKSPLSNIIMLSEIIEGHPTLQIDEDGRTCLTMLRNSAQKSIDLVNGVLKYSRHTHLSPHQLDTFSLRDFLNDLILRLEVPEQMVIHLPEHDLKMITPKIALTQILSNLIGNAIKYNDKLQGMVRIDSREDQEHYYFTVADNGRGIPPDKIKAVFNLFYRIDEHDEQTHNSSGIGLSIVKKLVDRLHGNISVNSTPGAGTVFEFFIRK